MSIKWVVVVNRTEAKIFSEKSFRLIAELTNELGREKNRALTEDKPGLSRSRLGSRSSVYSLTGEKNPHEDVAVAFSKKVDAFLKKQLDLHRFDELVVVAEPKMMGRLKQNLDKKLQPITHWHARDLSKVRAMDLPKFLNHL
jgi:protein required for attachment to host cells